MGRAFFRPDHAGGRFIRNTALTPYAPWTCPNCQNKLETLFCPACGERSLNVKELTIGWLLQHIATALTSVDAPILRSFKKLFLQPGALTVGYQIGQRKLYVLPIALFLYANVVFFAMQTIAKVKIFATTLEMHLHDQFWKDYAQQLVTARLEKIHTTLENYAPIFNQAIALNAKTLIALMVLPLLYARSNRPFAVHAVFSLHFFTFLMMLWTAILAGVTASAWLGGPGLEAPAVDHALSILQAVICLVYLFLATRRVYDARGVSGFLKSAALVVGVMGIFLGYRFLLFVITLYSTGGAGV